MENAHGREIDRWIDGAQEADEIQSQQSISYTSSDFLIVSHTWSPRLWEAKEREFCI